MVKKEKGDGFMLNSSLTNIYQTGFIVQRNEQCSAAFSLFVVLTLVHQGQ